MPKITSTESGRFILSKSESYAISLGISGEMQKGKSTFLHWSANEICRVKHKMYPRKWKSPEWDYEKYCATNFKQFVKLVDENKYAVIGIEEAGFEFGKMDFHQLLPKLLSKIIQTQAYKRNIYPIVLPHFLDYVKYLRNKINFLFECYKKYERQRLAVIRPSHISREYWKLKDDNLKQWFLKKIWIQYSKEELSKAKEFTDWLEGFKSDLLEDIIEQSRPQKQLPFSSMKKLYFTNIIDEATFIDYMRKIDYPHEQIHAMIELKNRNR